jgi:hypothetical protein
MYNTNITGNLIVAGKNNILDIITTGNVTLNGTADSTKLTGQIGTVQLAAGVENCDIHVGVTAADNVDGSNNSILGSDGLIYISGVNGSSTNRIKTYKLT